METMRKKSNIGLACIVFLSGASALIFENLWFRLAGLAFGNDIWASTLVLAGFMGGLALGNGLAIFRGHRWRRPVRLYAFVEGAIAMGGLMLVLVLPGLTESFGALFRAVLDHPWALNPLRLLLAFGLLLIPTTAMGLTLPLLVKALIDDADRVSFGHVLGKMYGWNTAGAVAGTLVADAVLVQRLGITASGIAAAALNLVAAAGALALAARRAPSAREEIDIRRVAAHGSFRSGRVGSLLAAGFLAGGILLAFEVVWFRFLLLYNSSTGLMFSVMLAVVLLGIALGGMAASAWVRRHEHAPRFLTAVACLAGVLSVLIYARFHDVVVLKDHGLPSSWAYPVTLAFFLMFPVSLLSGVLFTLIGEALHREIGGAATTTGLLTVANTLGSMLGATSGGFFLLPVAGIEKSFFVLALAYGGVGLLMLYRSSALSRGAARYATIGALGACALAVIAFPSGAIREHYGTIDPSLGSRQVRLQAVREGLTETIRYLRHDLFGKPFFHTMMTNSHAMSGTGLRSKRYMRMYAYWPAAVHPDLEQALLICFGVGTTAKALTETRSLESIDIVDISRDIVEMSEVVYPIPADNPVNDPRVRVHIEDGRFFLQTTDRRYDLITGEPPPLRMAGCANLYSQEYFQLLHDRLRDGGIVTYWLPVYQVDRADTYAILKAFSNVFSDCTLWTGAGLDWMMVGTRNARGPVSEESFTRQWKDPAVAPAMQAVGLERPEQLGATFLMDTPRIRALTEHTPPLVDNFPKRLKDHGFRPSFERLDIPPAEIGDARSQFESSDFIRRMWPEAMRQRSLDYFRFQAMIDDYFSAKKVDSAELVRRLRWVKEIHDHTDLFVLPLWLMDSGMAEQAIADRLLAENSRPFKQNVIHHHAIRLAAARQYADAEILFARLQAAGADAPHFIYFRIFLLAMAGEKQRAQALAGESAAGFAEDRATAREFWSWAADALGLHAPPGMGTQD